MTRRYNAKHPDRARSHYRARLRARGYTGKAPTMEAVEVLRKKQEREERERREDRERREVQRGSAA